MAEESWRDVLRIKDEREGNGGRIEELKKKERDRNMKEIKRDRR
jgi:hypothetical protein